MQPFTRLEAALRRVNPGGDHLPLQTSPFVIPSRYLRPGELLHPDINVRSNA
jgi:hypothetical protein